MNTPEKLAEGLFSYVVDVSRGPKLEPGDHWVEHDGIMYLMPKKKGAHWKVMLSKSDFEAIRLLALSGRPERGGIILDCEVRMMAAASMHMRHVRVNIDVTPEGFVSSAEASGRIVEALARGGTCEEILIARQTIAVRVLVPDETEARVLVQAVTKYRDIAKKEWKMFLQNERECAREEKSDE